MDPRKKISRSDKYLIAEQPGMTVLLTGLFISFFFGYTAKSLLSPSRVSAQIEKAASHIHKDVKVSFTSAQLSLSDGFFPRMAVIISQVRMESAQKCWGSPVLDVDELRLPLSFWAWVQRRSPVQQIEADNVKLTLREDFEPCERNEVKSEKKEPSAPAVSLSPTETSSKYQNDIRSLSILDLKIVSEKHPQYSSEFMSFAVKVKSFAPKVIEVNAKTHLLKDQQVGDYLSHANLFLQYKESPQATLQSHFFGNWREGHYSLIANYNMDEKLLAMEADLKHIPLSQILGILQKYGLASRELNGRQAWLSSKARLMAPIDQIKTSPLEIRDLRLEGDVGDLRVDKIDINSIEPLRYQPIALDIKKLDIGKLLQLLNRPPKTNFLGELGVFTGRAQIESDRQMRLTGEHRGLEFVFSNKGQRELQIIERMAGDIDLVGDSWSFQIQRVEPKAGAFLGRVKIKADRDFKSVDVKTQVDELTLSPAVQKLMTNGGGVGILSLDLEARLKEGQMSYLKGLARLDGMKVEGMMFGKTKMTIDWSHGEVVFNAQSKSFAIEPESVGVPVLEQVTPSEWWEEGRLEMNSLSGVFTSKNLQGFSWKNVQGQVGKSGKFLTEGAWNEAGALKGAVYNREGKTHHKWLIEGTRSAPTFVEETSAGKRLRK